MSRSITVIGAGMVGVCTALHLQQRGLQVTLVDRGAPGGQTSFGNAGVIDPGSLVPMNNPDLLLALPGLLMNNRPQLRFAFRQVLRQLPWLWQFLNQSRGQAAERNARALQQLLEPVLEEHKALMQRCGNLHRLSENGWLKVYRRGPGLRPGSFEARQLALHDIPVQRLSTAELHDLEPALKPIFKSAALLTRAARVNNPGALVGEYAERFVADGGRLRTDSIDALTTDARGFTCRGDRDTWHSQQLVITAGPWSDDLLTMLGYRVPLSVERGYHQHWQQVGAPALTRSVHDVQGGYLIGPMEQGLRITTGVELADRDAPSNLSQLEQVMPKVRQAIELTAAADQTIWRGSRPVLPDSLPMIGRAPDNPGLWMAFGHQHVGMMSGPVTGKLLAQAINHETPDIDLTPFSPGRYLSRHTAAPVR